MHNNGKAKPIQLLYGANLSHGQMRGCVNELLETNILYQIIEDGQECLCLTESGYELLERIIKTRFFQDTFGL